MTGSDSLAGFRLYLDTRYPVSRWPFDRPWEEILAHMPDDLPHAGSDFDIFLPDDHYNRAHGPMARAHASVRTEMAVFQDDGALLVLLRLWYGTPLATRLAPPKVDGAGILLMADADKDGGVYFGMQPDGQHIGLYQSGFHPDSGNDAQNSRSLPPAAYQAWAADGERCWVALFRVPLTTVPGLAASASAVRFTAYRSWGETCELSAWATSIVWAPQPAEMGTLLLPPSAPPADPRLYRADLQYDAETERGELVLGIRGIPPGQSAPVVLTINTHITTLDATGDVRHAWSPEDGTNAVTVKVGDRSSILIPVEKWSGHRLFVRYPGAGPLPTTEMLADRFWKWHTRKEREYIAPGTWTTMIAKPPYGLDHNCAFQMEPYALACLYLDRRDIYLARVRESCERIVAAQQPNGVFFCYHFGAHPAPFDGGAFGHGSASEALCLGYRVFGEARYLEAARRAAEAYALYSLESNTNYVAFVLWHLAELHELTGDFQHIERALWYTRHVVIRGMNPSGAYPGHNYYTGYGTIVLKGLAKLLRVLPPDHEFYPVLRERTLRFANQILSRQRANGLFEGCNRMYYGFQHTVAGLFEVARALPGEIAGTLEPALIHMLAARQNDGEYLDEGLDLALMSRLLAEKPKA